MRLSDQLIAPRLVQIGCFCFLMASLTACHRRVGAVSAVSVQEEILPQPVTVGPATITIKLSDTQGNPLSGAGVMFEGDMSHPGMSPIFAAAKELPVGRYQAQLDFGMAGDWVVILHIKLPNGQTLERQVDVKGVRSN